MKPFARAKPVGVVAGVVLTAVVQSSSITTGLAILLVQQGMQAVHRVRQQLVKARTALVNRARGLLAEYGIVIAQGVAHLRRALPEILEDPDNALSAAIRELLAEIRERTSRPEQSRVGCGLGIG